MARCATRTQRSTAVKITSLWFVGYCDFGKSVVNGEQAGFPWLCTLRGISDAPLKALPAALSAPREALVSTGNFLLFNWTPEKADVTEAEAFIDEPPPYRMFVTSQVFKEFHIFLIIFSRI